MNQRKVGRKPLEHAKKTTRIKVMNERFLKQAIIDLANIMPNIENASFHVPTIITMPPKINIGDNLETDISGMYVIGEAAGVSGILAAAEMGIIAANEIMS